MDNLLFIFEGEKTESQILKSLQQYYVNESDKVTVEVAYCNNVYELYDELNVDTDLDTYVILKDKSQNSEILKSYTRDQFSQIYLFFDYEYHANKASDENLLKLLDFFNDETDKGKLYISYPMIESLKHQDSNIAFKDLVIRLEHSRGYKRIVNDTTLDNYQNVTLYTRETWNYLITCHLKKMLFIVKADYRLTEPSEFISQQEIFKSQLDSYINKSLEIAILNAFPIFVCDYYGVKFIRKIAS